MSQPVACEKPASGTRLHERIPSPTGLAAGALCGIVLAFYYRLWLPDLVLTTRDAFRFFLPVKQYLIERLSAGELPQWFPYEALGRPILATAAAGVFHPFTALYFLLPVPDAYRTSTLLSCLAAALGAFALGRTLQLSRTGSVVAGIAFALSGYVASMTENLVYLYSTCLLPVFCAGLEKALAGRSVWVVAPAAIWATVFLNGDIQTGYYYAFIAVLWTAARAPGGYRQAGLRLALIAALTVLLAGIQLGPSWAVFMGSDRVHSAAFNEQALYWSTHPLRLVTIVAGPIDESLNPVHVARHFFDTPHSGQWASSLYLGIPLTGLALLGARHRRDLRVLAWLGGAALLLALGRFGGLYELFYKVVPLWSAFRTPEKLMGVSLFAVAMLAGAGLDALRAGQGHLKPWLAAAILGAGAGLGLLADAPGAWVAANFDVPAGLAHAVTESVGRAFLFSAVAACGTWLILSGIRAQRLREAIGLPCLLTLITLDLARANLGVYHTGPAETASFVPPFVQAIAAREGPLAPGRFRIFPVRITTYVVPERIKRLFAHDSDSIERRQALDSEHNAQFHLESANRYLPAASPSLRSLFPENVFPEVAARFNVAYYIGRRYLFEDFILAKALVAELPEYDLALVRNPTPAKPRAYLSPRPEGVATPVEALTLHTRPEFLSGGVDLIETADPTLPGPAPDGLATIESYAPEEVRVRVETLQAAVLVLLDTYDNGWTATLENGSALPILKANALVRAVVVPAGARVVTFRYETPLLRAGAAASLVGGLLCLALIGHAWRQRRRPEGNA
jgi:hypothetical protein